MAATTRLISIVGKKNSGKTTLVVALASEFSKRGRTVGTLKHGTHPASIDHQGKDTWRHYHEGNAERVLIESSGTRVMFQRVREESDPVALTQRFMTGMDIVIAEGFTQHPVPKIEVFRREAHASPRFDPAGPHADWWIAMVADTRDIEMPFPVFTFSDTSWLVSLSAMAWDRALLVTDS